MAASVPVEVFEDIAPHSANALANFKDIAKNLMGITDATFEQFRTVIKDTHSIISGSAVLNSLFNSSGAAPNFPGTYWKPGDLDIYVHAKDFIPIRDFLISKCRQFLCPKKNMSTGTYSTSFFKMNKILKMYKFSFGGNHNYCVDLMMVQNSQPLEQMILNYDLSCCKNIYDGDTIKGVTPGETIKGKATLSPAYFKVFAEKNRRTMNRIKKYERRGFSITITGSIAIGASPTVVKPYTDEEAYEYIYELIFSMITKTAKTAELGYTSYHTDALNFKDVYEGISDDFPAHPVDKTKLRYGKCIDDGFDPNEFDSREKYVPFGTEYVETFDMLVEEILARYEAWNPVTTIQKKRKELKIDPCIKVLKEVTARPKGEVGPITIKEVFPELKGLTCFDDVHQGDFCVCQYMAKNKNIIVKIGENFKGYDRNLLLNHMKTSNTFYTSQKIGDADMERLKDKTIRFFELLNTGLDKYILIPYTNENFIKKYKV